MQGVSDPTLQGGPEIGPPNADCHLQCALRRPVSISFGSRRIACAGQLTHVKASLALYCPLMEAETTAVLSRAADPPWAASALLLPSLAVRTTQ